MIRILIADDQPIVRSGVRMILENEPDMRVVGEVSNGDDALRSSLREACDILLLDVSMPGKSAVEVLRAIGQGRPELPVVILTTHNDETMAIRFMRAGARGYVTKDREPSQLLSAIRKVASGRRYVSDDLAERLLDAWEDDADKPPHDQLSPREFNVLVQLASGKTVGQIAHDFGLSPRTISTFRGRILKKMKMKDNFELTTYALKHGLVH